MNDISPNQLIAVVTTFLGISVIGLIFSVMVPNPSTSLPLIVIFGLMFFVCALAVVSVVLHRCNPGVKVEALGLPTGSIRALIALSLIVIFAIMVIYMYGNLQPTTQTLVSNVTTIHPDGTITSTINSTDTFVELSPAQKDFSLQTLTTVSTLVVSLSSFYFGAKAVGIAKGETQDLTTQHKEPKVEKGKEFEITVKTTPEGQTVVGKVIGDNEGTLRQNGDQFKYKPSDKASGTVDLKFTLAKKPSIQRVVEVTIIEPATASKSEDDGTSSKVGTQGKKSPPDTSGKTPKTK